MPRRADFRAGSNTFCAARQLALLTLRRPLKARNEPVYLGTTDAQHRRQCETPAHGARLIAAKAEVGHGQFLGGWKGTSKAGAGIPPRPELHASGRGFWRRTNSEEFRNPAAVSPEVPNWAPPANWPEVKGKETCDIAATRAGFSRGTYVRAKTAAVHAFNLPKNSKFFLGIEFLLHVVKIRGMFLR